MCKDRKSPHLFGYHYVIVDEYGTTRSFDVRAQDVQYGDEWIRFVRRIETGREITVALVATEQFVTCHVVPDDARTSGMTTTADAWPTAPTMTVDENVPF